MPTPLLPLDAPIQDAATKRVPRVWAAWFQFFSRILRGSPQTCFIQWGTGTPESVVTAPVGSLWIRTNGGASTVLYVKESGTGNTGWRAV